MSSADVAYEGEPGNPRFAVPCLAISAKPPVETRRVGESASKNHDAAVRCSAHTVLLRSMPGIQLDKATVQHFTDLLKLVVTG